MNRSIHVRLGGEVHHDVRGTHQRRRDGGIRDVALHEPVTWAVHHLAEVFEPPRVRELVQRGDVPIRVLAMRPPDKIRSDKSGSAGDQYFNHWLIRLRHHGRIVRPPASVLSPEGAQRWLERADAGERERNRQPPVRNTRDVRDLVIEGNATALRIVMRHDPLLDQAFGGTRRD
jgi:hypothetical protein